jgi:hypothetical protein
LLPPAPPAATLDEPPLPEVPVPDVADVVPDPDVAAGPPLPAGLSLLPAHAASQEAKETKVERRMELRIERSFLAAESRR